MSLAGHGPKHGSRHRCLIIASTEQRGPVLSKGVKVINNAALPPEGGPAEVGGLSASSLPWSIDRLARMPDSPLKSLCTNQCLVELQTILFQAIHFNISHLFALIYIFIYQTLLFDSIRCYHSGPEWTWEQWQWRGTPRSQKLQDWSLTLGLFNIITRTLIGRVLPLCKDAVGVFCSPSWLGQWCCSFWISFFKKVMLI